MADTELHYVQADADTIWREMMNVYYEEGGDVLYPGDEKEMLLRAVQAYAMAICAKVDNALKMDTLTYATRDYLKEYGLKQGCVYIDAVAAEADVEITMEATGYARTLDKGTVLTADGVVLWETKEDIELTGTAQTITATIVCQTAGVIGNGLLAGTEMQFMEGLEGLNSCVTTGDASGGTDAEEEEAYRERIRNFGLSTVTTGPSARYEAEAMAVSSQILDAAAIRDAPGEVGVYLIFAEGAAKAAIMQTVTQALSAETVRPLTDQVTVREATPVAYTLNVTVYYSQYAGIGDDVAAAISDYQAWQDQTIGRAFNPDRLIAMLYQAGCDRVQFQEGSGMGGDAPTYTEIEPNEHCSGTITLEVVNT